MHLQEVVVGDTGLAIRSMGGEQCDFVCLGRTIAARAMSGAAQDSQKGSTVKTAYLMTAERSSMVISFVPMEPTVVSCRACAVYNRPACVPRQRTVLTVHHPYPLIEHTKSIMVHLSLASDKLDDVLKGGTRDDRYDCRLVFREVHLDHKLWRYVLALFEPLII